MMIEIFLLNISITFFMATQLYTCIKHIDTVPRWICVNKEFRHNLWHLSGTALVCKF